MASTDKVALLPTLPPEIRNRIYRYLSEPSATPIATPGSSTKAAERPTTLGLTLTKKRFNCRHTTIDLVAVHHGDPGLLALSDDNVIEGIEYKDWLYKYGTTVCINVHFKGPSATFIHSHWDIRVQTHFRKLERTHVWWSKVARYEINILWEDKSGAVNRKGQTGGSIAADITRTLIDQLGSGDAKKEVLKQRGDVTVSCTVASWVVEKHLRDGKKFVYSDFLSKPGDKKDNIKSFVKEIRVGHRDESGKVTAVDRAPQFVVRANKEKSDHAEIFRIQDGLVEWTDFAKGDLLVRWELSPDEEMVISDISKPRIGRLFAARIVREVTGKDTGL